MMMVFQQFDKNIQTIYYIVKIFNISTSIIHKHSQPQLAGSNSFDEDTIEYFFYLFINICFLNDLHLKLSMLKIRTKKQYKHFIQQIYQNISKIRFDLQKI